MKTGFTIVIAIAGIYFIQSNVVIGIILLVWAFLRFSGYSIGQVERGFSSVLKGTGRTEKTNILLVVNLNIAGILNNQKVRDVFNNLRDKKVVDFKDTDLFIKNLLEIYKDKFKNKHEYTEEKTKKIYIWEKFEFNIKNNVLWKNKDVDFSDVVYHEISIPYKKEDDDVTLFSGIDGSIKIRFLIVNGFLKVQIGRFNKETSPKILADRGLAVYLDWLTISTFPLMYLTQIFPDSYLNFSLQATESYNHLGLEKNTDWMKDWKELSKERDAYNHLYNLNDDDEVSSKHIETIRLFSKKAEDLIISEGFTNNNKQDESGWYTPPWMEDNSIHYSNDCVVIKILDLNEEKKKFEEHYSSDYYHEQP